ncbi:transposase [Streptomyces mirabilis]|uniref:transposase n=1 Tax=Streptomyces mirabilis TaxID=68239 RepID=UPI0036AB3F02
MYASVAKDLGDNHETLRTWVRDAEQAARPGAVEAIAMEKETRQLRARVKELELEREILWRAASILRARPAGEEPSTNYCTRRTLSSPGPRSTTGLGSSAEPRTGIPDDYTNTFAMPGALRSHGARVRTSGPPDSLSRHAERWGMVHHCCGVTPRGVAWQRRGADARAAQEGPGREHQAHTIAGSFTRCIAVRGLQVQSRTRRFADGNTQAHSQPSPLPRGRSRSYYGGLVRYER